MVARVSSDETQRPGRGRGAGTARDRTPPGQVMTATGKGATRPPLRDRQRRRRLARQDNGGTRQRGVKWSCSIIVAVVNGPVKGNEDGDVGETLHAPEGVGVRDE